MMSRLRWFLACAALANAGAVSASDLPQGLFLPWPEGGDNSAPAPIGAEVQRILVDYDFLAAEPEALTLELPGGGHVVVLRTNVERRGPRDLAWRGWVQDSLAGLAILTLKNGFLVGTIETEAGVFRIGIEGGQQQFRKLEPPSPDAAPECAVDSTASGALPSSVVGPAPLAMGGLVQVDGMVLYTPSARDAAGSDAAIQAEIQGAVDFLNTAFTNSNVGEHYNLVHTQLINRPDPGNNCNEIDALRADGTVSSLRSTHRADLVHLITTNAVPACGCAEILGGYGVTCRNGLFAGTFAHEIGHNHGMDHSPFNPSCGFPPFCGFDPWSFGHFANNTFRTIMTLFSAPCAGSCPRVAHFSNPNVSFGGQPTGLNPGMNPFVEPFGRDNARTANSTGTILASNFPDPTLTVTKLGTGGGTVTSVPAGIACGATCQAQFPGGALISLKATPDIGSELGGFGGDADCTDGQVTLSADIICTATFDPCSIASQNTVSNETFDGLGNLRQACNTLSVGPSVVVNGELTLRAGNSVTISGIQVNSGGTITIENAPPQ